jgi:hypothetical protein
MIFVLTLAAFVFALAAMALGVIVTGRRLRCSCGGSPTTPARASA